MEYIILLLIIILVSLLFKIFGVNIKNNKKYLLTIVIILTLFLGLRGPNVGLDMGNYYNFFVAAKNSTIEYLYLHYDFEIGFKMLTKLISFILFDFRFYIVIISTLSMIGIYYLIKDYSKNYFASIFLFITFNFFIYYICTLRQCLAISILLCSLSLLKRKNILCYVASVMIASLFHKTALVFLFLPLFKYITFTSKMIVRYISLCVVLFIIKNPIIDVLTELIYDQYIGYRDTSGEGYMMLLLILAVIIGICFVNKKFDINKEENKYFTGMLLLALPFQILSTKQGLVARIVLYFTYSFIILIPNNLEIMKIKYRKILYPLFYILLFLFYVYQIFTNSVYVQYTIF
ncbi:MAG: EpsG family protein [Bacilli bacterium]